MMASAINCRRQSEASEQEADCPSITRKPYKCPIATLWVGCLATRPLLSCILSQRAPMASRTESLDDLIKVRLRAKDASMFDEAYQRGFHELRPNDLEMAYIERE